MADQISPQTDGEMPRAEGKPENGTAETEADQSKDATKQNGNAEKQGDKHFGKIDQAKDKITKKQQKIKDKKDPPGGYDATPIPTARDGYTLRFTFHRAENLPISDLNSRSSDPYIKATLTSSMQKRHKEDPNMVLRTHTVHENVNPEWNSEWIVACVPSNGFRLKCRLYDEDPSDHDDRLGNVTIDVNNISQNWPGIRNESFLIKKRMGSKRAYMVRGCASMLSRNVHMSGHLVVSIEVLGISDKPFGRMYTTGKTYWFKHYSPMIGRLAGTKAPERDVKEKANGKGGEVEKYDFQANEFQLQGPVPAELYHRFVEFKPFVKGMFTGLGLRGHLLNKALHHQHNQVYNFSKSTEYGEVPPRSAEATLQFLKMVHYDEGGRIFTYVLTLDGLLRFTETGKEFGIDLLSKHTMHSDVNIYIACSGEFFIRRLAHPTEPTDAPNQKTHPDEDLPGGPPNEPPPEDPKSYELVIDNDSGTYRPKGDLLPKVKEFLNTNFPGLHVVVKECTDKKLDKWKDEQRKRKKKEGDNLDFVQNSDDEVSSSDEENLANKGKKQTKRTRAFEALEDPGRALKDLIPGEKGQETREVNETEGDAPERDVDRPGT